MPLTLVATPIGNLKDISLRGLESLRHAECLIGEERKPLFRLMKELGLETPQEFYLLNEHSTAADLNELLQICKNKEVALVTDCGTPGFSDPGSALVALCRANKVPVTSNPGASSLTTFLSLCGVRIDRFDFIGFLPRDREEREKAFRSLTHTSTPLILMDTPYRLSKFIQEGAEYLPNKQVVLGMDLTRPEETFLTGSFKSLVPQVEGSKREFMALLMETSKGRPASKPLGERRSNSQQKPFQKKKKFRK